MKRLKTTLTIAALISSALPVLAAGQRVSPHETNSIVIGDGATANKVTISYGRPYSKDPKSGAVRKIWGTLVPYGQAWRLGADEATLLTTEQPLLIGETTIPAGSYTLYLVPSETGTTKLAFSTHTGKWGIPVDEKADLARVDTKKETLDKALDQLTIALEKNPSGGGVIKMMWETTQFSVPFTVKK